MSKASKMNCEPGAQFQQLKVHFWHDHKKMALWNQDVDWNFAKAEIFFSPSISETVVIAFQ